MTSQVSLRYKVTTWLTLGSFLTSSFSPLRATEVLESSPKQVLSHPTNIFLYDQENLIQKIEAATGAIKSEDSQAKDALSVEMVSLTGESLYRISQQTALDILSLNHYGDEFKQNTAGSHPVVNLGEVHFKSNRGKGGPLTPAMEKAIYLLQMLLVGKGIAPSTLLVLKNVNLYNPLKTMPSHAELVEAINQQQRSHFFEQHPELQQYLELTSTTHIVQASRSVKGISLLQFFENVEQGKNTWQDLDGQSFSAQILSSLIIHPFDGRADNFMVEFDAHNKGHIIGIDNDKALSEPIVRDVLHGDKSVAHYVGNKNILYCLQALMDQEIDPRIRKTILTDHPQMLLLKWLELLEQHNNQYQTLKDHNVITASEAKDLELPLHLPKSKTLQLIAQLEHMQAYLRSQTNLTHNQLFEFLYPLAYHHYKAISQRFPNPLDAIVRIFPGRSKELSLQQTLPMRERLKDGRLIFKALQAETAKRQAHEHCTQSIAEAAQELIHHCDMSLYPPAVQAQLIVTAGRTFPASLPQAHSSWKNPAFGQYVFSGQMPAEILSYLKPLGIDLSSLSKGSLLHETLNQPSIACQLIDQLLAQGLSIEAMDNSSRSVLEVAMDKRLTSIVNHLIAKGAKGVWRETALGYFKALDPRDSESHSAFKRLEAANPELVWYRSLDILFPTEGLGKPIAVAHTGKRVLPMGIKKQLFDVHNNLIRVNHYGRRNVGRIEQQGYALYVKQAPEFPGTEQGVSLLVHTLVGHGAPYGDLLRMDNCPYYVSQEVKGVTLQDILYDKIRNLPHPKSKVERYLTKLEPKALSEMLIMAMLINPEDGKPDNYILEPLDNGQYRLVGIDNDHAFGPTVAREGQSIIPQVKCVLFCLDQMQDPIHPAVWERFRTLDSGYELKKWLMGLAAVNKNYEGLFEDPALVKQLLLQKEQESFIGVAFTPLMLSRLYEKFIRLQHTLTKKAQGLTHLELLKYMEPFLYERYSRGFDIQWPAPKGSALWQRFVAIDGPYFGQGKAGAFISNKTLASFFTSLKIPLKEEIIDRVRKGHHIGPELALLELDATIKHVNQLIIGTGLEDFKTLKSDRQRAKFFRTLEFNLLSLPEQTAWVEALAQIEDHRILRLKGCEILKIEHFTGQPPSPSTPPASPKPSLLQKFRRKPKPLPHVRAPVPLIESRNLRKLDVSGCKGLTETFVGFITKAASGLEYLNLSHLGNLQSLNFRSLSLKWLSVEGSQHLKALCLKVPHLLFLNVSSCLALASLDLKVPAIEELDLRSNPLLTDTMLDSQLPQWLQLKTLKVQGCNQISFIEVREKWPFYPAGLLKEIEADAQEQIVSLLDPDNAIKMLDLNYNKLGDEGAAALAPALQHNTTLTTLSLWQNKIGAEGAAALASALQHNTTLTTLDLKHNKIGDEGAVALASALQRNTTLTSLDLGCSEIWSKGVVALASALQHNTTLTTLLLSDTSPGYQGVPALASAVQHNTTLTTLLLRCNGIGNDGIEELAPALQRNTTLTSLDLGSNGIGNEGVAKLVSALQHNITLTSLDLSSNGIGNEGAVALASALQRNTPLTTLYLSDNKIGDEGVVALAPALQHNTPLTTPDLNYNRIGAEGAKAFAPALQHNTTVTTLDLSRNKISNEGVAALASAVQYNTTLTTLLLRCNGIGNDGIEELAPALQRNTTLTSLDLGSNGIGAKGAVALASALQHNTTLTRLDLWNNNIGAEGAVALASALQHNTTLTKLDLGYNQISAKGAAVLAPALQHNTTLTTLDLRDNLIGAEGAVALASALQHNTTLTSLDLSINQITTEGVAALASALQHNTTLTSLAFNYNKIDAALSKQLEERIKLNQAARPTPLSQAASSHISADSTAYEAPFKASPLTFEHDTGLTVLEARGTSSKIQYSMDKSNESLEVEELKKGNETEASLISFPSFSPATIQDLSYKEQDEQEKFILNTYRSQKESDSLYVGLSLEGAGMRTYMTAYNLQRLEEYARKPLHQLVDYIGGTSMGGMLALGIMATADSYRPLWSLTDMMHLFRDYGAQFFPKDQGIKRQWDPIMRLDTVCYPADAFEKVLGRYFKDVCLSDVLVPTLVTTLKVDRSSSYIHTFESTLAQLNQYQDYFLRDVARATSVAPGTFSSAFIRNVLGKNEQSFIDAGARCNNPADLVYQKLFNLYKAQPYPTNPHNIFIFSMGGGQPSALMSEIEQHMANSSNDIHLKMQGFLGERPLGCHSSEGNYYRLQPCLEEGIELTDTRAEAFDGLEDIAHSHNGKIEELARILTENKDRKHPAHL